MKKKILYTMLMCSFLCATPMSAQNQEMLNYKGTVIDVVTGSPVQGAIVRAAGDRRYSSMTDEKGQFTIQIPKYTTQVMVQAPSYELVRAKVPAIGSSFDVKMHSDAFTPVSTEEVRNSNKQVVEDFSLSPSLSVEDELARRSQADVRVLSRSGNPAQGASLFIGGYSSIFANAQPLIVVDGVILDRQTNRGLMHDGYVNNVLSAIGVNDIERVQVLKNATAIYGAKGANGAIIIETKRSKSMATRIDVDVWAGVELTPKLPDMMNASQYRLYASDIYGNTTSMPDFLDEFTANKQKYATYHNNTDWTDLVYREAITQNYNVNVQGGDNVASYNLAIGYANAQSTLKNNNFSRLNLRFNTDVQILKPLLCYFDVAYSNTSRNLRNDGMTSGYNFAPGSLGLIKSPLLSPYQADRDGNITSNLADADNFNLANPISILENGEASNKNKLDYTLFTLSVNPEWKINKRFTLSERANYVLNNVTERYFIPDEGVPTISSSSANATKNQARAYSSKQTSFQSDTRINWNQRFGVHEVSAFAGFRYLSDTFTSDGIKADNSAGDKMPNITSTMDNRMASGLNEAWKSTAAYLNVDWNYAQKYFLTATATTETSTRFGKNAKGGMKLGDYVWGLFPSVQAAWVVTGEKFMRNIKPIDYLKLNVGYDISGNDDIDSYASRSYFSAAQFINQTSGLVLANIGNDQLKWETTKRLNMGFDLNMFNNRLGLSFDYFFANTGNLLVTKTLSGVGGLKNYLTNDGKMKNQGYSLSLRVKALELKDFAWEVYGSIGHYKNEVTALPDGDKDIATSLYGGEVLTRKGQPLGVFYGYKTAGVFATSEEAAEANLHNNRENGSVFKAGDVHFVDQDGNHVIDANDKTIIGDPNPDIYGNFGTMLKYRKWQLTAQFAYSVGNDIYNYQRAVLENGGTLYNQTTALLNRWVNEGQVTNVPRATMGDPMENSRFSDRWIEDGSYLKLKTLKLSYTHPLNLTWIQGFTVWAAANNLFTITKYLGSDPEVSVGSSPLYQGIDRGLLGQGRSFVLGVKINL